MGMKIGGQRRLVIPSGLAQCERGSRHVIPPHATLVLEVQLVGIK